MAAGTAPEKPRPLRVADLFSPLGEELLGLLRSLGPDDWRRPTVCPNWEVRDLAAHLLDTAWRRLSIERDGWRGPAPRAIDTERGLVAFLNRLNADWVEAFRRVSPTLLVALLADAERQLAKFLLVLDPEAPALFPVAWAGEQESRVWFDVARELTERWHHQQQIRLAVGIAPLQEARFSRPVFQTFARALPRRYKAVAAPTGTAVVLEIAGHEEYAFTVVRNPERWELLVGAASAPAASIRMAEEPAWRLFTNSLSPVQARAASRVEGDEELIAPIFATRAVMV